MDPTNSIERRTPSLTSPRRSRRRRPTPFLNRTMFGCTPTRPKRSSAAGQDLSIDRSSTRGGGPTVETRSTARRSPRRRSRWTRRSRLTMGVAAAVLTAALGACGGDDSSRPAHVVHQSRSAPALRRSARASACRHRRALQHRRLQDRVEILPQSATEQRIQLARRLAAEDSVDRPDEPRPRVHGRVRRRRLPRRAPGRPASRCPTAR